jgi:hypothetical protein
MLINRKITLENINIPEVKSVKITNKVIVYVMKFNYNHVLGVAKNYVPPGVA